MFIGHYALGFAAKRVAPGTALGTLFVAPTLSGCASSGEPTLASAVAHSGVVDGVVESLKASDDEAEVQRHVDYIHADPVRHGLVRSPRKWPFSSLHAYIEHGLRPLHWSGDVEARYGARGN